MRLLPLLFLFALAIAACSKEQRTVNKLDGIWQMVGRRVNGVPDSTFSDMIVSFQCCKLDGFNECQGSIRRVYAGTAVVEESDFKYSSTWGDDIDIDFDFDNPFFSNMNCDILELNKSTLTFEYRDSDQSFDNIKLVFRRVE